MKPIAVVTGAVAFATLLSQPAPAEDLSSQIVGIWNVTSVECVGSDGEECSTPRANKRITRSGHYIKGCSSGRYTIEGSKVTIVYDDPPNFPPTVLEREVSVSGNLTMLKFTVATRKEVSSALSPEGHNCENENHLRLLDQSLQQPKVKRGFDG